MLVKIFGPNLNNQSKGTFHVHSATCKDNVHYGPWTREGGDLGPKHEPNVEVATRKDVVEYVYGDFEDYDANDSYTSDFYFFPCVKELK